MATEPASLIRIDASHDVRTTTPWLTGACIEDVNHEIYGGLYSQMIFGESFQEPADIPIAKGFTAHGQSWRIDRDTIGSPVGNGNKLIADHVELVDGKVSVEVRFDDNSGGNAGLIVRTSQAGPGIDQFYGYEVALDPERQIVRLGHHCNDFTLLQDVPCDIPIGKWIKLETRLRGTVIEVFVDGDPKLHFTDDSAEAIKAGSVGLRHFHRRASYRHLAYQDEQELHTLPFVDAVDKVDEVSRMWTSFRTHTAQGRFELDSDRFFVGRQSQQLIHAGGEGEVGLYNQGLNRWGMAFQSGRLYEGVVYFRSDSSCEVHVSLQSKEGDRTLAETTISVSSNQWTKHTFSFTPDDSCRDGRFAISLTAPGKVNVGYVSLQPGEWRRFHGLPVRRDVAELLQHQGITMLRYGGSMVNTDTYRWQNMIGPRAERPPYRGHWYDFSTNGWGIFDFMEFCEAAGFEYIPTLSMNETPESVAQFAEYATGDASTAWGRKRIANGHARPYHLKYLQLGNEERVDEQYAQRFIERAQAIWNVHPELTLVVGDFVYSDVIHDSQHVTGAASGITNLNGQQQILEFAKSQNKRVWFDLHVWTGGPGIDRSTEGMLSFIDALEAMQTGANFQVVVFELNANNHSHRRAIGNALALHAIEQDGRIPVTLSANCLQPDGQNDNGWDQGLLFLSPSSVWLQPPGYVTQLFAKYYQPRLLKCTPEGSASSLACSASLSEQGDVLCCRVINATDQTIRTQLRIDGFQRTQATIEVAQLVGQLDDTNTEEQMNRIAPKIHERKPQEANTDLPVTIEPYSITIFKFQ
ncbi:family 16 glycoside hydrolase [Aeoliella mucimassa]|uniref:family 16 glycoside hydrolase n=1 Tax=Aeoliella mucimassa TaxID=2527972 RepID=UPI0018D36EA1|nr:family 16 glycoside hydrolase [Aeoliella mucimassa]